jgi:hypothetical protein
MIYALLQTVADSLPTIGAGAFFTLLGGAVGYGIVKGQLNTATRDIEGLKKEREKDLSDLRGEFRTSMGDMQAEMRNGFNGQGRRLREMERVVDQLVGELRGQGRRIAPRRADPDDDDHPDEAGIV